MQYFWKNFRLLRYYFITILNGPLGNPSSLSIFWDKNTVENIFKPTHICVCLDTIFTSHLLDLASCARSRVRRASGCFYWNKFSVYTPAFSTHDDDGDIRMGLRTFINPCTCSRYCCHPRLRRPFYRSPSTRRNPLLSYRPPPTPLFSLTVYNPSSRGRSLATITGTMRVIS